MEAKFGLRIVPPGSWSKSVYDALTLDAAVLLRSLARVTPVVTIVPAFGMRALVRPARGIFALALAVSVAGLVSQSGELAPWELALEALRGTVVALSASVGLWSVSMAGGIIDNLRGASEGRQFVTSDDRVAPIAILLSLLASYAFLAGGGPASVVHALSAPLPERPALTLALDATRGIELAIALSAPLIAVSFVVEVASSLVARSATPASLAALIAPLRAWILLLAVALLLSRIEPLVLQVAIARRL